MLPDDPECVWTIGLRKQLTTESLELLSEICKWATVAHLVRTRPQPRRRQNGPHLLPVSWLAAPGHMPRVTDRQDSASPQVRLPERH